jgi:uncharacterized protein
MINKATKTAVELAIMIDRQFMYAIVGASNDETKYGNIVLRDLKSAGYNVIPINIKEHEVIGLKAYKSVIDVEGRIDVAVFIIPPAASDKAILEVKEAGIRKVWFQPGSESDAAIKFCKQNNINCIYGKCIMVERRNFD